jgi:hypothetical protein
MSCVLDVTDPANVQQALQQAEQAAAIGSGLRVFDDEPARGRTDCRGDRGRTEPRPRVACQS